MRVRGMVPPNLPDKANAAFLLAQRDQTGRGCKAGRAPSQCRDDSGRGRLVSVHPVRRPGRPIHRNENAEGPAAAEPERI